MLDCGTRIDDYALCKLYKYMLKFHNCGGCCGEIEVDMDCVKRIEDGKVNENYCSQYFMSAA